MYQYLGGPETEGDSIVGLSGGAISYGYIVAVASNGIAVTLSGNVSDKNFKKNIKDTDVESALELIKKIKFHSFDWKGGDRHTKIGFIAQELAELDEGLAIKVKQGENSEYDYLYQLNIDEIVAYAIKAIQEHREETLEYKKEIDSLKEKADKQEKIIDFLINKLNCANELKKYLEEEEKDETRN